MKKNKNYTLDEAIKRIEELEAECNALRAQVEEYANRLQPGRKPHNEKWQADYAVFAALYEQGTSISDIIDKTPFSRRTIYRYKKYYDSLNQSAKPSS